MTKDEFDRQVVSLLDALHSVSYSLLQNPEDQADAVQECIKKALIKRDSLREDRYLKTWLVRILINECHNIGRAKKRSTPFAEIEVMAPPQANPVLFEALGMLEEHFRLPVVLHHIAGYSTREIAKILRVPEGTIKYRLVRGRTLLEKIMTEQEAWL